MMGLLSSEINHWGSSGKAFDVLSSLCDRQAVALQHMPTARAPGPGRPTQRGAAAREHGPPLPHLRVLEAGSQGHISSRHSSHLPRNGLNPFNILSGVLRTD